MLPESWEAARSMKRLFDLGERNLNSNILTTSSSRLIDGKLENAARKFS